MTQMHATPESKSTLDVQACILGLASGSPLLAWLHKAVQEVESSTDKLGAFLRLRYDEMGRLFPHDVFSVQEATPDFFAEAIRYLTTGIPENRPGIKPEDAKHDIYWRRYRDWMKANKIAEPLRADESQS